METITSTFPSWETYADALRASLNTEFYFEKFPKYGMLCNTIDDADLTIIQTLLKNNYNAQDGFEAFVNACLNGSRYIDDMMMFQYELDYSCSYLQRCVAEFINHGAHVTPVMTNTLFEVPSIMEVNREDWFDMIRARGIMLSVLHKYGVDFPKDWNTITAMYWEDISPTIDINMQARMYLKHTSELYN